VKAPPGPEQTFPFRQQPYLPFEPSQQLSVGSQPPARSGQHVQDDMIQPVPQDFRPGAQDVARSKRAGDRSEAATTEPMMLMRMASLCIVNDCIAVWLEARYRDDSIEYDINE
jgi:hypothetical protein